MIILFTQKLNYFLQFSENYLLKSIFNFLGGNISREGEMIFRENIHPWILFYQPVFTSFISIFQLGHVVNILFFYQSRHASFSRHSVDVAGKLFRPSPMSQQKPPVKRGGKWRPGDNSFCLSFILTIKIFIIQTINIRM